jgi:hypothetical protein
LIDGLANFLDVAKNYLRLSPPIEVFAGLNGVRNCWLAVEPSLFDGQQFVGPIMSDVIGETVAIQSFEHDPFDALVKLFNRIYDEAFVERPNVRTVGKSQR